jgi:hypothetical protein
MIVIAATMILETSREAWCRLVATRLVGIIGLAGV